MPLYVTCSLPSGRLTTLSEDTLPLGLVPGDTVRGCQSCVQAVLVQMNLPARSPLRRYSVSPWPVTRTVPLSLELDAVRTLALEAAWLDDAVEPPPPP